MLIFLPCNPVKAIAASSAGIASGARGNLSSATQLSIKDCRVPLAMIF